MEKIINKKLKYIPRLRFPEFTGEWEKKKLGEILFVPDELDGFYSSADVPTLNINSSKIKAFYLLYFLGRRHFYKQLERMATGTGSKRIHETLLLSIRIEVPLLEEQTKIALFLSSIDKKIQIEKNLLENYKTQKQYLLQQMFLDKIS